MGGGDGCGAWGGGATVRHWGGGFRGKLINANTSRLCYAVYSTFSQLEEFVHHLQQGMVVTKMNSSNGAKVRRRGGGGGRVATFFIT